jgi:hypothetical protein
MMLSALLYSDAGRKKDSMELGENLNVVAAFVNSFGVEDSDTLTSILKLGVLYYWNARLSGSVDLLEMCFDVMIAQLELEDIKTL